MYSCSILLIKTFLHEVIGKVLYSYKVHWITKHQEERQLGQRNKIENAAICDCGDTSQLLNHLFLDIKSVNRLHWIGNEIILRSSRWPWSFAKELCKFWSFLVWLRKKQTNEKILLKKMMQFNAKFWETQTFWHGFSLN